jgi:hypothetical protein
VLTTCIFCAIVFLFLEKPLNGPEKRRAGLFLAHSDHNLIESRVLDRPIRTLAHSPTPLGREVFMLLKELGSLFGSEKRS